MTLDTIIKYNEMVQGFNIWFYAIKLRNSFLVLITDNPDGDPAIGNIAIGSKTRIFKNKIISSSLPFGNFKHEILAKSLSEILSRKTGKPIFLMLDVRFESSSLEVIKGLKMALLNFCKMLY
ncbi:MAG: proteasome assembly chaperone 4 family protein [Promethearchaeota archaeon]